MFGSLQRILSVSELTLLVRDQLEQGFRDIWVEGEVSNLRSPGSGHLYFTLKDQNSQIRAVLFRAEAQRLRFALQEGLHVIVHGRLTVYEPRGEYQAVLDYLEPKGIGAFQMALEQLKEKLAREGLFDQSRKRSLPLLPRCVGLVTSLSGAAVRDMLSIIQRR
ncbi:MAG: exodeoxyribonuclease VII large subunit, partial [Nitrospiraceae bacterium]